jgi:AcrR family transcriptional regulator
MGRIGDNGHLKLIEAAFGCFATHGYEKASSRLIASEAGVALGLIHRHFDGKRGLLEATDLKCLDWARQRAQQGLPSLWGDGLNQQMSPSDELAIAYLQKAVLQPRPGSMELTQKWLEIATQDIINAQASGKIELHAAPEQCARILLMLETGALTLSDVGLGDAAIQKQDMLKAMSHIITPCL